MVRSPLALRCSREQNALHTLIRHRHLTPSCGGRVPTAERTLDPARMFMESLTTGPELENSQGHTRPGRATSISNHVRYATKSDDRLSNCDSSRWATTGSRQPCIPAPLRRHGLAFTTPAHPAAPPPPSDRAYRSRPEREDRRACGPRPIGQDCHPSVDAKMHRQRTMLSI